MAKESKEYFKAKYLWRSTFILVVAVSICLPAYGLHAIFSSRLQQVKTVSGQKYDISNSLLSQTISERLSSYDRIRLLSNVWAGTRTEIKPDGDTTRLNELDAVQKAREHLAQLSSLGLYPLNQDSNYENWYSWETHCYQCTDNTFHTYSAYLWEINLFRYDSTEQHDIYLSDDGKLLAVHNNAKNKTMSLPGLADKSTIYRYLQNTISPDEKFSLVDCAGHDDVHFYSGETYPLNSVPFSYLLVKGTDTLKNQSEAVQLLSSDLSQNMESYEITAFTREGEFFMQITPYQ